MLHLLFSMFNSYSNARWITCLSVDYKCVKKEVATLRLVTKRLFTSFFPPSETQKQVLKKKVWRLQIQTTIATGSFFMFLSPILTSDNLRSHIDGATVRKVVIKFRWLYVKENVENLLTNLLLLLNAIKLI